MKLFRFCVIIISSLLFAFLMSSTVKAFNSPKGSTVEAFNLPKHSLVKSFNLPKGSRVEASNFSKGSTLKPFNFPEVTPDPDAPSYLFYDSVPFTFIKRGVTTNGEYTLRETNVLTGQGVPPHIHQEEDEWLYVKEGNLQITVGSHIYELNETPGVNAPRDILHAIDAPAGTLVYCPRFRLHGVLNVSNEPAKLLVAWNPPGFEDIFKAPGIISVTDFSNLPTPPPNYPEIYGEAALSIRGVVGSASYNQFGDLQYDNVVANEDNHGDRLLKFIAAGSKSRK